jgi:ubiquitin C-terminal hydrolase/ADP-ribosylglycohydrolase
MSYNKNQPLDYLVNNPYASKGLVFNKIKNQNVFYICCHACEKINIMELINKYLSHEYHTLRGKREFIYYLTIIGAILGEARGIATQGFTKNLVEVTYGNKLPNQWINVCNDITKKSIPGYGTDKIAQIYMYIKTMYLALSKGEKNLDPVFFIKSLISWYDSGIDKIYCPQFVTLDNHISEVILTLKKNQLNEKNYFDAAFKFWTNFQEDQNYSPPNSSTVRSSILGFINDKNSLLYNTCALCLTTDYDIESVISSLIIAVFTNYLIYHYKPSFNKDKDPGITYNERYKDVITKVLQIVINYIDTEYEKVFGTNQSNSNSIDWKQIKSYCNFNLDQLYLGEDTKNNNALKSMRSALYAIRKVMDSIDFESQLVEVLMMDIIDEISLEVGDAYSNASVAGALLGAFYGALNENDYVLVFNHPLFDLILEKPYSAYLAEAKPLIDLLLPSDPLTSLNESLEKLKLQIEFFNFTLDKFSTRLENQVTNRNHPYGIYYSHNYNLNHPQPPVPNEYLTTKGLVNFTGNTCYLNSFFQIMYTFNEFRKLYTNYDIMDLIIKEHENKLNKMTIVGGDDFLKHQMNQNIRYGLKNHASNTIIRQNLNKVNQLKKIKGGGYFDEKKINKLFTTQMYNALLEYSLIVENTTEIYNLSNTLGKLDCGYIRFDDGKQNDIGEAFVCIMNKLDEESELQYSFYSGLTSMYIYPMFLLITREIKELVQRYEACEKSHSNTCPETDKQIYTQYIENNWSPIKSLFGIFSEESYKCANGHKKTKVMFANYLSLVLPHGEEVELNLLLNMHTGIEQIEVNCDQCAKQVMIKKTEFVICPPLLIIIFQRGLYRVKNTINIKYEDQLKIITTSQGEVLYYLVGLSFHSGGVGGGHYTVNVKRGNTWYFISDSIKREIKQGEDHKLKGAYLLAFVRNDILK